MELIYKELCLLKAQLKQSFILVLLIIAGTFYFNYKGLPASYMTFNFPFMISMVLAVQFISASIMVEKKNKTFEKMLTIYKMDNIIFSKVALYSILAFSVSAIYSIVARIVYYQKGVYQLDMKLCVLEMIILAVSVLLMCSTFAVVYIFCNNQSIISIASIGITVCVAILGSVLQTGEVDMIYFILGIVGALAISIAELKVLCAVNKDFIMKD